ncbi:hypothetical protein HANVADRAFT_3166 [Hanseniaspora valbyensis NRRL Y-1626]|uniref:Uncharacterized protein n=1 Tax=Hanseniaspora valbyensis NRRL Y-1626 TaxID=766949 RepID=A0A1B7TBC8_9ASCO|nr:hypothetical protein HANVADRAFT_3166 [Hanseniaspora valbyensis NRRL Y-1626]
MNNKFKYASELRKLQKFLIRLGKETTQLSKENTFSYMVLKSIDIANLEEEEVEFQNGFTLEDDDEEENEEVDALMDEDESDEPESDDDEILL